MCSLICDRYILLRSILESSKTNWKIHGCLKGTHPQCLSFDPSKPNRAYCGTFGNGLWKTDDYGETWDNIGIDSISSKDVTSVSVDHHNVERTKNNNEGFNTVYVGTNLLDFIDPMTERVLGENGAPLIIWNLQYRGAFLQGHGLPMCGGLNQIKLSLITSMRL